MTERYFREGLHRAVPGVRESHPTADAARLRDSSRRRQSSRNRHVVNPERSINCAQCGQHIEDPGRITECPFCESDNFLGRKRPNY